MRKSRISLQTFAFGGRNKPMKPYSQLDKNSTNPLWKQIIMKFTLESGMSNVSVVVDIKTVDNMGNQLFINQQKSLYLSDSPNSTDKICASTLQQISDTSHLNSLPFVLSYGAPKYVVLTPTFICKSNATESHIISLNVNGVTLAQYPIRVYGPRSGQRSRFLKKDEDECCQPAMFIVESSENMEPNGSNSSSGMQAVRLSSSQGLRLNSSAGLPLTYEGMELESLTDAKPNVANHHITQANYTPMLDDDDNHYVTPEPCSDIAKPWNSMAFPTGSNVTMKSF
jgi:hypothetical protein